MAQNEAQKMQEDLGMTTTITLNVPVVLADGRQLTSLTMRRAKVADLRAVSRLDGDAAQEIALAGRLAGLVPEDMDLLDLSDYKQVQDWFRLCQEKPVAHRAD
nr:MAG TPA: tail assembly chaperone protein [Caudoviricetes sp.]